MDNDVYRHVNNVVYYSFFDTAVNRLLIDAGLLDIAESPVIGLVVETSCHYFAPIAFPDGPPPHPSWWAETAAHALNPARSATAPID